MLKENPKPEGQDDMFRSRLENIISLDHELVKLSDLIDWDSLEADLSVYYCPDNGRPGASIRMMAGLLYLKELKGISDEEVCATWQENPYFQYFCGEEFFQHHFPVEQPTIGNFRKRIGEAGLERLLQETVRVGLKSGVINRKDLDHVTVDTTVQEKAVKFPTDAQHCHIAREELVLLAHEHGVDLRQSYVRVGKKALDQAKQHLGNRKRKLANAEIKICKNYLGRVARVI